MKDTQKPLKDGEKENAKKMDCFYFFNRQILENKFFLSIFFYFIFYKPCEEQIQA